MKRILISASLGALVVFSARAQWAVQDAMLLQQTVVNTYLAKDHLESSRGLERKVGDASQVTQVAGAANVLQSLSGGAQSASAATSSPWTGQGAMTYTGGNLYCTIGGSITAPDGTVVERDASKYRKFEAAHQATANYLAVLNDTEARRIAVLDGIKATTEASQKAANLAETMKLQVVAASQIAALTAIDGERSAALGCVLAHNLDNNTDQAKQEQARRDERAVDFSGATVRFAGFLTPPGASPAAATSVSKRK